jgi:uncharacterized membrane protein YjfL (UPF0719 family)
MNLSSLCSSIPWPSLLSVCAWTLLACCLLIVSMKLFDLLTPGKLAEHVFKDGNIAAAIVYGSALIALAVVIASAMH